MNDRELLERAARAAYYHYDGDTGELMVDKLVERRQNWNPLENDGDAFRLMVALDIHVAPGDSTLGESWAWDYSPDISIVESWSCQSRESATRRAIVRAAAEMVE